MVFEYNVLNNLDEEKLVKYTQRRLLKWKEKKKEIIKMEIVESEMVFVLDKSYSHDLKSFIKDKATERIKGFIENFLEKDLKERKKAEFKDFKEEFEEYINCGEVYESDISDFPLEEQIKICQASDDFGSSYLEHFDITSEKFPINAVYVYNCD